MDEEPESNTAFSDLPALVKQMIMWKCASAYDLLAMVQVNKELRGADSSTGRPALLACMLPSDLIEERPLLIEGGGGGGFQMARAPWGPCADRAAC